MRNENFFLMFRGGAKPMELKCRAVLYCIVLYRILSLMNNFVSLRCLRNYQTKVMNVFRYKRDAESSELFYT
jgi:hypothetical protein